MTDRLYHDPDLVQFYDVENAGGVDFEYCLRFAADVNSVLDLGCGTGQLAAALADGRVVVGVDPAGAMLEIARRRHNGDKVDWIKADARSVRLGRSFDLVVLTGHAFQVFLTPEDQAAVLSTIAAHLKPGGRFIFDTRNPAGREWLEWTPDLSRRTLDHPRWGAVEAWNDVRRDASTGVVTYTTCYRIPDGRELLSAESSIAFPEKETLAVLLDEAGLYVERWLGDWEGRPYVETSPEIIPIGGLRHAFDAAP